MKTPDVHAVGMAWYLAQDYAEIKALMKDAHLLHRTHAEWQLAAEQGEQKLRANGVRVYRAIVRPTEFRLWCSARSLDIDAQARQQFASEFAAQEYRAGR